MIPINFPLYLTYLSFQISLSLCILPTPSLYLPFTPASLSLMPISLLSLLPLSHFSVFQPTFHFSLSLLHLPLSPPYLFLPDYLLPMSTYLTLSTYLFFPTYSFLPVYLFVPTYVYLFVPTYVYLFFPTHVYLFISTYLSLYINQYYIAADPGVSIGFLLFLDLFSDLCIINCNQRASPPPC